MAFVKFDMVGKQKGRSYSDGVSLTRDRIHFNSIFAKKYVISMYNYAIFYYDKETDRMAFSFQNTAIDGQTYKLTKHKHGNYACSIGGFYKYFNIRPKITQHHKPEYDEENLRFIVNL